MPEDPSANLQRWRASLHDAAKEVFSTMLATELSDPAQSDPEAASEVTAMVGLGGSISGVLTFRCGADVSTEIACRMLGLSRSDAENHRVDAVGETCNMIAGAFKARNPDIQNSCVLSVPTVIIGDSYAVHSMVMGDRVDVPLMFDDHQVIWFGLETRD